VQPLTPRGHPIIDDLARRHGVRAEAVLALLRALAQGQGAMAQFDHPDLGGAGQWMRGGMTMTGDPFDGALKAKVEGLCSELSALLSQQPWLASPGSGLPHGEAEPQQQDNPTPTRPPAGNPPRTLDAPAADG
jgi:hypothetical protein